MVEEGLIRVHLGYEASEGFRRALQAGLPERLALSEGERYPKGTEILVCGRPDRDQVLDLPHLRALIVPFTGIPPETLQLARDLPEVSLHNLHHNAEACAEMALALLFAVAKRIVPTDRQFRQDGWTAREADSSLLLLGKTALIVGAGAIGQRIARRCEGIGMKVALVSRTGANGTHPVSELSSLLPTADVLFLALPATPETDGLIGPAEISLLKPTCILVNVGRGSTVDERALYDALDSGRIFGAGLDVWYQYPSGGCDRPSRFPFEDLDNVVMSPHRASDVYENDELRAKQLLELLREVAEGRPMPNEVNKELGY
ncbi:MAG: phosphoglycerate dehydrogenase [Fimbriimonadales bacterium]|nr:MAG: phosphoglycerate dehydrogenase [Fimbriimonadales bacterium]